MYTIIKEIKISAAHHLNLNYQSKCCDWHGHNYLIRIHCKSKVLNNNGMICDCNKIKNLIVDALDHKKINDIIFQPTMENIAKYVCDIVGKECFKVEIKETENNMVIYEKFT